ncbi:MAG: molybdate ABC transporter permease subunit [Lachnospiraceae bacterium]
MPNMLEIMKNIDWSPLFISLKTGILATIFAFFLGVAAARMIMRLNNTAKAVVDGILTLPLVLPPTVAGFFLLLLFSLRRPFGKFLMTQFDIKIVQTWPGCVIAALVIAFPLMYRNARAAFEQVDVNVIYAGRTLGMSERKIFWKIVVPMAGPGLASGTVLAFARAIGEYGATSMLAGNILGKTRTVSVAIASEVAAGNWDVAGFWVCVIVMISFVIVALINFVSGKNIKNVTRWM